MSPDARMFSSGRDGIVPEFGIDDYFENRSAGPNFLEMVSATNPRLATAYDETSGGENARNGTACAKVNLADDVITYGEVEAK